MGKSNSSYVRIRQKATTESEVLDVLMEGDQVEILGEEGDWYKVQAKGHIGYVSKAFITKSGESTNTENTNSENNNQNVIRLITLHLNNSFTFWYVTKQNEKIELRIEYNYILQDFQCENFLMDNNEEYL